MVSIRARGPHIETVSPRIKIGSLNWELAGNITGYFHEFPHN